MTNELDRLIALLDDIGRLGRLPHPIAVDALIDQLDAEYEHGDDPISTVMLMVSARLLRAAAREPAGSARMERLDAAISSARSALGGGR